MELTKFSSAVKRCSGVYALTKRANVEAANAVTANYRISSILNDFE